MADDPANKTVLVRAGLPLARLVSPKSTATTDFILRVVSRDLVAPALGTAHLSGYFEMMARGAAVA